MRVKEISDTEYVIERLVQCGENGDAFFSTSFNGERVVFGTRKEAEEYIAKATTK
jgi:hypothetical protein